MEIIEQYNNKFTFIIPVKNEEGNICKVISGFNKFKLNFELIFIVCRDSISTFKEIEYQYKQNIYLNTCVIQYEYQKNFGKADAVLLGFKMSSGDVVSIFDADCSVSHYDAVQIAIKSLESNSLVTGNRLESYYRNSGRIFHYFYNFFISNIFNLKFKTKLKDILCGSKSFPKKLVLNILKFTDKNDIGDKWGDLAFLTLALDSGYKVSNLSVNYYEREWGQSKISCFADGISLILYILKRKVHEKKVS
jgi:glycosyltransferase involved in cell wall biosynthesis